MHNSFGIAVNPVSLPRCLFEFIVNTTEDDNSNSLFLLLRHSWAEVLLMLTIGNNKNHKNHKKQLIELWDSNHSRSNTFFFLKRAYLKPMGYLLISESLWDFTQEIWISVLLSSLSPPKRDAFNEESAMEEYHFFIPRCYKKSIQ